MSDDSLKITEIFFSLQGEARTVGVPTVFIRLTGCPLRCQYCDTAYAFSGGTRMPLAEIFEAIEKFPTRHITVTGGEPLAQQSCIALLQQLCDRDYEVSLETSGAIEISAVDDRVSRVMDLKTPGSGEQEKNLLSNLDCLTAHDQLKFVICDRRDYEWSRDMLKEHQLDGRCEILFSPSHQQLDAKQLAEWILEDGLAVRFQMQLHKLLWQNLPGK